MTDAPLRITNCHVHLFTLAHVPSRITGSRVVDTEVLLKLIGAHPQLFASLPGIAKAALTYAPGMLAGLLRLVTGLDAPAVDRLVRFARMSLKGRQQKVFEHLELYYPRATRFVVLPMDMAAMGRGAPLVTVEQQHEELLSLAQAPETGGRIVPFAAVDPRRRNALALLERFHRLGCRGLKIYPNLGYLPDHPRLMDELYPYCAAHGLPVMTHCSRGGVKGRVTGNELDANGDTVREGRSLHPEEASSFADPAHYMVPLACFPGLRICLAHFGGEADWERYFTAETRAERWPDHPSQMNWLAKILALVTGGEFPGLWTDISYTIFHFERYHRALKVFLTDDALRARVLFGSDFYMTEIETFRERDLSFGLRAELGEGWFRQIAETNPATWLGER